MWPQKPLDRRPQRVAADDTGRIRRLPIQVPLRPGESPLSFVRRLATANHLRTSYLREYLVRVQRDGPEQPGSYSPHTAAIDITRLSLVTGRTINALQHVFPDLKPATEPPTPAGKRGQLRRNMNRTDKIRAAAADDQMVCSLSVRFRLQRSTIIDALVGKEPDKKEEPLRSNPKLSTAAHHIDSRLAATPEITITQISNELKTQHGLTVGYSTVRSYINRARARHDDPRDAQHLLTRAALYELIRNHAGRHDLISTLMTQFSADRDTVISALTSKAPWPNKPRSAPEARRRWQAAAAWAAGDAGRPDCAHTTAGNGRPACGCAQSPGTRSGNSYRSGPRSP
jgi:hypothetical protein